uniref:EGF-like domain-containing protein n=1 Tax=Auxenochlorella protothecoides TaxID=3075 RepID=A0A1D1ZTQ2_AUXPR
MGHYAIYACVLALLFSLFSIALAQDACSGHGRLTPSGGCDCDNPWPAPESRGWTGKDCSIPVYGSPADSEDMTDWCRAADQCDQLEPQAWVCFAAQFPWDAAGDSWNHLAVRLARTSPDEKGDPDLFGLFSGGKRGLAVPTRSSHGYDFQDTSAAQRAVVVKKVTKAAQGPEADYEGVLLCVRSYGAVPVAFSLKAARNVCPVGFDAGDASPLICSTRQDATEKRYEGCTADGQCLCTGQYAKPVPEVVPGLGFEDCSAPVTDLNATIPGGKNATVVSLEHQHVEPDRWQFYRFHVAHDDFQVSLAIVEESETPGMLDLFLKAGVPPSTGVGQFDARPRWNAAERDRQLEVLLDARPSPEPWSATLRPGDWYAGVLGGLRPANFTLLLNRFDCPLGCSGHGTCDPGTPVDQRRCTCDEGYGGEACSKSRAALEYGDVVQREPAQFEYEYFLMPAITDAMLNGSSEVIISASYYGPSLGQWAQVKPAILLSPTNHTAYPTAEAYTHKLVLEEQNVTRTLTLCPTQLVKGEWALAVYNPLRGFQVGFSLTLERQGHCLNGCSGHGKCSEEGVCRCEPDWQGGDCSVSGSGGCEEGSRRPAANSTLSKGNGTCWQECRCPDEGAGCRFDEDECVDYTCPSPSRRAGTELRCVVDACVKDVWTESRTSVCLLECACPEGGGPCEVSRACSHRAELHPSHHGPTLLGLLLGALLGGGGLAGFIYARGIPPWFPLRRTGFGVGGLYQELSDAEGL